MKILKRIGSIIIDVLVVIIFIISVLVVVANITAKRENGQANVFGYTVNSVQTDSMEGAINEGDLVISKIIKDVDKPTTVLEKGQIVSFFRDVDSETKILVTHRIVEVKEAGNAKVYVTRGDNAPEDDAPKTINEIESVYLFRIPWMGNFIDFIKLPIGFILCLVLPLLAFIAWHTYKLVSLYLKAKKLELEEEAAKISNSKQELTDADKEAIIAEYLAKQKAAEAKAAEESGEETPAEPEQAPTEQSGEDAEEKSDGEEK